LKYFYSGKQTKAAVVITSLYGIISEEISGGEKNFKAGFCITEAPRSNIKEEK
jgi:hypothetical protein